MSLTLAEIKNYIDAELPTTGSEYITASIMRTVLKHLFNQVVLLADYSFEHDDFTLTPDMLDADGEYTRTHGLDTDYPGIILWNTTTNKPISRDYIEPSRVDANNTKFSFYDEAPTYNTKIIIFKLVQKELTYGANIVRNHDFSSGTGFPDYWSNAGCTWYNNDTIRFPADGGLNALSQEDMTENLTRGDTIKIMFDIKQACSSADSALLIIGPAESINIIDYVKTVQDNIEIVHTIQTNIGSNPDRIGFIINNNDSVVELDNVRCYKES